MRRPKSNSLFSLVIAALPFAAGCVFCTTEFRIIYVNVIDADGNPVLGVTTTAIVYRTGERLAREDFDPEDNECVVATDSDMDSISSLGDWIVVEGTKDDRSFQAIFRIGLDGCHIYKVKGPDTVTLQ